MEEFVEGYYKFDEKYKERREITERELFSLKEQEDMDETRLGLLNTNEMKMKDNKER
jgi:hypothetical protein